MTIEAVTLTADAWHPIPVGTSAALLRLARPAPIWCHIGPAGQVPPPNASPTFIAPPVLRLAGLSPDRQAYLRAKAGTISLRLELLPEGAALTTWGRSPFTGSENGSPPNGITRFT